MCSARAHTCVPHAYKFKHQFKRILIIWTRRHKAKPVVTACAQAQRASAIIKWKLLISNIIYLIACARRVRRSGGHRERVSQNTIVVVVGRRAQRREQEREHTPQETGTTTCGCDCGRSDCVILLFERRLVLGQSAEESVRYTGRDMVFMLARTARCALLLILICVLLVLCACTVD